MLSFNVKHHILTLWKFYIRLKTIYTIVDFSVFLEQAVANSGHGGGGL